MASVPERQEPEDAVRRPAARPAGPPGPVRGRGPARGGRLPGLPVRGRGRPAVPGLVRAGRPLRRRRPHPAVRVAWVLPGAYQGTYPAARRARQARSPLPLPAPDCPRAPRRRHLPRAALPGLRPGRRGGAPGAGHRAVRAQRGGSLGELCGMRRAVPAAPARRRCPDETEPGRPDGPGAGRASGQPPGDAAIRARLSLSRPSPEAAGPGCPVCLAAGLAERDAVMHASGAVGMPGARRRADEEDRAGAPGEPAGFLCPAHLHQAVAAACERPGRDAVAGMLDWHARLAAAWARALPMRRGRARQASAGLARPCPACRAAARAAAAAAGRLLAGPAGGRAPGSPCLRHVLLLRAADRRGASRYVAEAASAARALAAELETAPAGLMPPWQRAVALTDGRVYGGGPPRPL